MITDEQVQEAAICIDSPYSDSLVQARDLLECYENSKWIEFDPDDKSTWPENDIFMNLSIYVLSSNYEIVRLHFATETWETCCGFVCDSFSYWQRLPEPPK